LITPARISQIQNAGKDELKQVSENLDAKTAENADLTARVEALEEENTALEAELESYTGADGQIQTVDSLLETVTTYLDNPEAYEQLGELLYQIDTDYVENEASEAYKALYTKLMEDVGIKVAEELYDSGYTAVRQGDYTTAVEELEKAWYFDQTNGEILYQLAQAYRLSENKEKAQETYEKVVELFPDTAIAANAQEYLENDD
jgi:Flp pilus assembly protein TadD